MHNTRKFILIGIQRARDGIKLGHTYRQLAIKKNGLLMLTKYLIDYDRFLDLNEKGTCR